MFAPFFFQSTDGPGYEVGNSLRFDGAQALTRTMSTSTSADWTLSFWVKLGWEQYGSGLNFYLYESPQRSIYQDNNSYGSPASTFYDDKAGGQCPGQQKDMAAWYHVCYVSNSSTGYATFYLNGLEQFTNTSGAINSSTVALGSNTSGNSFFLKGYLAQVFFVDGTALAPTSFGKFNSDGVWEALKPNISNFGSEGYSLTFQDTTDIGKDYSGNGNNFTATGFNTSTQTDVDYSPSLDSPTNNHVAFLGLAASSAYNARTGYANQGLTSTAASGMATLNVRTPLTGKYYFEVTFQPQLGGAVQAYAGFSYNGDFTQPFAAGTSVLVSYGLAQKWIGASYTQGGNTAPVSANNVLQIAYDADLPGVWIGQENSWIAAGTSAEWVTSFDPASPTFGSSEGLVAETMQWIISGNVSTPALINTGQKPFKYTAPTGFEPYSSEKFPDMTIPNGSKGMRVLTDIGANILPTAKAAFANGLWWIKSYDATDQHQLVDSVRGSDIALNSPSGAVQAYTQPAGNAVAWCWNNSNPAKYGFEIVTYTGTGSVLQVSHNLGYAPEWMIVKSLTTGNFVMYHVSMGPDQYVYLNQSLSWAANINMWNNTTPTAASFTVGNDSNVNASGTNYVAYIWRGVPGYSSFGFYQGNASADGPLVNVGFKPAFLMTQAVEYNAGKTMYDHKRNPVNPISHQLFGDQTMAQTDTNDLLLLSNGFKITSSTSAAGNTGKGIYMAFAQHPWGGANVSPVPAY